MDNGAGNRDLRNDCDFRVDRFDKDAAAGIKSNDRCNDAGDGRVGGRVESALTHSKSRVQISPYRL